MSIITSESISALYSVGRTTRTTEELKGFSFATACPPDFGPGTRLIAVCGITDDKDQAKPKGMQVGTRGASLNRTRIFPEKSKLPDNTVNEDRATVDPSPAKAPSYTGSRLLHCNELFSMIMVTGWLGDGSRGLAEPDKDVLEKPRLGSLMCLY